MGRSREMKSAGGRESASRAQYVQPRRSRRRKVAVAPSGEIDGIHRRRRRRIAW
jgi:hypothetical protein